jgi:hypothetical protein
MHRHLLIFFINFSILKIIYIGVNAFISHLKNRTKQCVLSQYLQ